MPVFLKLLNESYVYIFTRNKGLLQKNTRDYRGSLKNKKTCLGIKM